jgi:multiple sugar transport system substrate-binding protein
MAHRAGHRLSLLLLGLLALTACGLGQSSQQASGSVKLTMICRCVANGAVNANLVTWFQSAVLPDFAARARSEGKQVSVDLVQFGGSDDELKARLALDLRAGKGEDVMAFDGFWIPEFASARLLKPLDQVASSSASWDGWGKIPGNVQDLLRYGGQRYGVPSGTDARVIWFRKDLFQKAGLPADWQPKSWDDIYAAADQIKRSLPGVTPMQVNAGTAMGEATTMQGLYPLMVSAGNFIYDFSAQKYVARSPGLLDALQFYRTVYSDKGYGDRQLQIQQDGRNRSFEQFRDGKIAMLWESDYLWRSVLAAGQYRLDGKDQLVSFAKIPNRTAGQGYLGRGFVTVSGGTGWVVNPNTKNAKDSWELLSFMFSRPELDKFETIEPFIPPRTDVAVPSDPVLTNLVKLLPVTVVRPNLPTYDRVSQAAQLATQQVVTGEMTPEQAQDAYAASVTQIAGPDRTATATTSQKK